MLAYKIPCSYSVGNTLLALIKFNLSCWVISKVQENLDIIWAISVAHFRQNDDDDYGDLLFYVPFNITVDSRYLDIAYLE